MTRYLAFALLYDTVLVLVCAYAMLTGGRHERWGAFVLFTASMLSSLCRLSGLASWVPGQGRILLVDVVVVASLGWLATTSTRFWPIWAFGFALADIWVSEAGAFLPHVPLLAYEDSLGVFSYLALLALALGSRRGAREIKETNRDGGSSASRSSGQYPD